MEVAIGRGGEYPELGRVTKSLRDQDDNPIGVASDKNPILDTRMYSLQFQDGHT